MIGTSEGHNEDNLMMLIDGNSMSHIIGIEEESTRGWEAASCRAGAVFDAAFVTALLAS